MVKPLDLYVDKFWRKRGKEGRDIMRKRRKEGEEREKERERENYFHSMQLGKQIR